MNIYYIGGSPCSGKSTIAQALAERFSLRYFRVDDRLDAYLARAAAERLPICKSLAAMTPDENWLRDPEEQCRTELLFYEETVDYLMADVEALDDNAIIEGAACMPCLMPWLNVPPERYIAIVPEAEFQLMHYRKRPWVKNVLAGCSDRELAFARWMKRDMLFAEEILRQAEENGFRAIVNDGSRSIEEMIGLVAAHFALR